MGTFGTRIKIITFTRDITAATGDVSYTGAGFFPRAGIFLATQAETQGAGEDGSSLGFADASHSEYCYSHNGVDWWSSANLLWYGNDSAYQKADLKHWDADGFTLTWTKGGSPTGTMYGAALLFS